MFIPPADIITNQKVPFFGNVIFSRFFSPFVTLRGVEVRKRENQTVMMLDADWSTTPQV